jgi:hypothetical protein
VCAVAEETYTYEKLELDVALVARCRAAAGGGVPRVAAAAARASAESLADASPVARRTKHEIAAAQRYQPLQGRAYWTRRWWLVAATWRAVGKYVDIFSIKLCGPFNPCLMVAIIR